MAYKAKPDLLARRRREARKELERTYHRPTPLTFMQRIAAARASAFNGKAT